MHGAPEMIKVTIEANVPQDKLEEFLTVIRAFDNENPGCHFDMLAIGGDQSVEEVTDMLERVGVPLVYAGRKQ